MPRALKTISPILLTACLSLAATRAGAQEAATPAPGFAIDRYNPAERGSDWFVTESLDLRGHARPALGLDLDWAHKPLLIHTPDGDERALLIEDQLYLHLGGSIIFWDRWRLGVSAPVAVLQSGIDGSAEGFSVKAPYRSSFGDLRLGTDVRLYGEYGSPFTAALGIQVFIPTGDPAQFTGDGELRVLPRLSLAGSVGMFTYAGTAGVQYRANDRGFAGKETGTEVTGGVSAGLRLLDGRLVVGPELFGSAVVASSLKAPKPSQAPLEVLFGSHFTAGEVRIGAGVGPGLTRGIGVPAFRVVGSIEWAPAADTDTDNDGIVDPADACPTVPGVPSADPKKNGCPPDRDNDGIPDAKDACPDIPGVPSEDPKKNGCPPDRDNDGVLDAKDACPDVAGLASADHRLNGCPVDQDRSSLLALDRDRDRVRDDVDKCPDVPGLREAPASLSPSEKADWASRFLGCPEDIDNDTILNIPDACPFAPGRPSKDLKIHGCPYAIVTCREIKITERIYFKTMVAALEAKGEKGKVTQEILEAVLAILKDDPSLTLIEVQGHASQDAYPKNQELSQERAASVVNWLVQHGVDPSRLQAKGYGTSRPAPGISLEKPYKELHQRVEFHLLAVPTRPECKEPLAKGL